jgi:hypothetical protein
MDEVKRAEKEPEPEGPKKPVQPEPAGPPHHVVLTFGGAWADVFESSLARQFAKITHLALGNPRFKLSESTFNQLLGPCCRQEDVAARAKVLLRLNAPTTQASELKFKFRWFVDASTHVLVDSALLDTAIGHEVITLAHDLRRQVMGVGTDASSSPLAAAYLQGIMFPRSGDEIVRWVLSPDGPV